MASSSQIDFFRKLTDERQFPDGSNVDALREQFSTLPQSNASEWIDKALSLPRKDEATDVAPIPPPF